MTPHPERLGYIRYALRNGYERARRLRDLTGIDPWFLHQIREIDDGAVGLAADVTPEQITAEQLRDAEAHGLQRRANGGRSGSSATATTALKQVSELRKKLGHYAGLQAGGYVRRGI